MSDSIETSVRSLYDDIEPSPQVRAEVLAALDEEQATPQRSWAVFGGLAAAAAILIAFLIGTPREGADEPITAVPSNADVTAERARNEAAYKTLRTELQAKNKGKWVVIADGKLAVVADSFEAVLAQDVAGAHRFVFQVGTEGDQDTFISTWYAPRFAGPPLAVALGLDWRMGPDGLGVWRDGGPRVKSFVSGPFPRMRFGIGAPGSKSEPLELFLGTVGPALVLTRADYDRMGLARFEVPGTHTLMQIPCTRVLAQVSLDDADTPRPVLAAVSRASDETMTRMARARHEFWNWGMAIVASATEPYANSWILFGNDRVLGFGPTAEAAAKAGEKATDFAYHRYLMRLPYVPKRTKLRVAPLTQAPKAVAYWTTTGKMVAFSVDTVLREEGTALEIPLVSNETAVALDLHMAEAPPDFVTDSGKTVRAGYAWRADGDVQHFELVATLLEGDRSVPTSVAHIRVSIDLKDAPLEEAIATLQLLTGVPFQFVGENKPKMTISHQAHDMPLSSILDQIAGLAGLEWDERAGVIRIGTKEALAK